MRLQILAAAATVVALAAVNGPAAAQTLGQSCVLHQAAADPAAGETVRRFMEARPGVAVSACSSDRGVSYQAMSPVRIEAPGVCRMSVHRMSEAVFIVFAADPTAAPSGAFEFMAEPDVGQCPERGKGRWIAVTEVAAEDFLRIGRFAGDLARGGRSTQRDGGCRKREDKLRRLVQGHALISVRRETPGVYAIQLLRSGAGYTARLELTADGVCVRGFGGFVV